MTPRLQDIVELAGFVADFHSPHDKISPYLIAERNEISYNFGHYDDAFDGLLEYQNELFHIYGNADRIRDESYPRARFTFAHELGHFYIDDHRQSLERGGQSVLCVTDFQSDATAEREADLFASYLLMPDLRFKSCARTSGRGAEAVRKLAELFGTSLTSTAIRYSLSNASPVIAMGWTSTARKWCWSSERFLQLTNNWAFKDPGRLPHDSETVRVLQNPAVVAHAKGTTLSTWFPRVRVGSRDDEIMIEEVMSIGRFGAITILYPA